ncbi:hypothetical protein Gotur_034134 [Gossypium turneri]
MKSSSSLTVLILVAGLVGTGVPPVQRRAKNGGFAAKPHQHQPQQQQEGNVVTNSRQKMPWRSEADLATDGVVRRSIPSAAGQAISSFLGMIDACFSYFRHQNNASILREKVTVQLYSDFPSFSIGSWTVPPEN